MKHIPLQAVSLLTFLASVLPVAAAEPVVVPWNEVCRTVSGHDLVVTTSGGEKVEGYCVSIDVNQMTVQTRDHGVIKVARKTLSRIEMQRAKGHQLSSLRKGVHKALKDGFDALLSPWAPAGIMMIPGTLAWGAVATPFCILGDLRAKLTGTTEIRPN
ncbi:MAG TPA: hypothetical protein VKU01_08870 [Bryobacteraceae bacterium]|nr:hypothetical protein [Bryobacteraceae bacterium]